MNPISQILVPTDFSKPAGQAIQYALDLAKPLNAKVSLLHVVEAPNLALYGREHMLLDLPNIIETLKSAASQEMKRCMNDHPTVHRHYIESAATGIAECVVEFAKKHAFDLVVMPTHGRTGVSRLLLGSVAERVVRLATCPILTVHGLDK